MNLEPVTPPNSPPFRHASTQDSFTRPQFVCLSGLPRTGSTLLSAILSQNSKIHAEGNSAVCQLMWDIYCSCTKTAKEQLLASNRTQTIIDMISSVPSTYYKNVPRETEVIVDKCRSWTIDANVQLLTKFIDPASKIIVLERSILDIVKSFAKLYLDNGKMLDAMSLLNPMSEPLMRSIAGIQWAKK